MFGIDTPAWIALGALAGSLLSRLISRGEKATLDYLKMQVKDLRDEQEKLRTTCKQCEADRDQLKQDLSNAQDAITRKVVREMLEEAQKAQPKRRAT